MRKRSRIVGLVIGVALFLPASAVPAVMIDFTGGAFAAAQGQTSFTTQVDGVGITLGQARTRGTALSQSASGLGIDGGSASQIDATEELVLRFDQVQFVQDVYVSQLYRESGWRGPIRETGWYSVDGGARVEFRASADGSGRLIVPVGRAATSITFGARLIGGSHDYALAAIGVGDIRASLAAIPEPVSVVLLGIGGIVVGAALRRRGALD